MSSRFDFRLLLLKAPHRLLLDAFLARYWLLLSLQNCVATNGELPFRLALVKLLEGLQPESQPKGVPLPILVLFLWGAGYTRWLAAIGFLHSRDPSVFGSQGL